jgi:inhibitor of cysteine peptidase
MIRIGTWLLLLTLLASCGGDATNMVLDASDSGSEILVATGDQFQVELESNPSTGYSWNLDLESATSIVTLRSSDYSAEVTEQVGAPGVETFVFEATGPGATIIRLEYIRPFDELPIPERVVEFIVRVDGVAFTRGTGDPPTRSSASADDIPIGIAELLGNGEPRTATVMGFVLWDDTAARLCEVLMESFPPQCGGLAVVIANPEALDTGDLQTAQGVQWTDRFVELTGSFDGNQLTLDLLDP